MDTVHISEYTSSIPMVRPSPLAVLPRVRPRLVLPHLLYVYHPLPEYAEQRRSMKCRHVYRVLLLRMLLQCAAIVLLFSLLHVDAVRRRLSATRGCSSCNTNSSSSTYYKTKKHERRHLSTPLGSTVASMPPRLACIIPLMAITGMRGAAGGRRPALANLPW